MSKYKKIFLDGVIFSNPTFVLVLGTCPTLGLISSAMSAMSMGLCIIVILTLSNVLISAMRKVIPNEVRIPCYIVLIAGFVSVVSMVLEAYAYSLYESLGVYLSLIVVNCIILGRAEMFANKNTVLDSALDGVGMGLGFTLALTAMACIREAFGSGTFLGMPIPWLSDNPISILSMAPGGFCIFGCMIALVNKLTKGKKVPKEGGCAGCPAAAGCKGKECEGK